ncbi:MAG: aminoacyl-tRNA hydrolase [Proteobacteria bacterium]|nr:aminoacyl-tRNA hydrolase [Pseudomonadota bacterium]
MKEGTLVVGLGNPGPQYANTRHNLGFMVIDALAAQIDAKNWIKTFSGLLCRAHINGQRLDLLKPMTFMNLSGQSVSRVAHFYRIGVANIILVHDDLDLPFKRLQIKKGGGTGGHKGIESVKQELGSAGFTRIRMGIGRPSRDDKDFESSTKFVLSNFSVEEEKLLTNVIDRGVKAVECVARNGITIAMNEFNKRGGEPDEL